jgi:4-hydroxy-tetrahydrodipicolinate synthase
MSLMLMGGRGVISVTANVVPKLMHEMCIAAIAGDAIKARSINQKLLALHQKLFVEANPIPVKWVLQQMGMIQSGIRLPLVPLSSTHHEALRLAMHDAGI